MKAANGYILCPRATLHILYSNPARVHSLFFTLSDSTMQYAHSSMVMTIKEEISKEENRCLKENIPDYDPLQFYQPCKSL